MSQHNVALLLWAESYGYAVDRLPPAMRGDDGGWFVPLGKDRGTLSEAGPGTLSVWVAGTPRHTHKALAACKRRRGWLTVSAAEDGFSGHLPMGAWGPEWHRLLRPKLVRGLRRVLRPQGSPILPFQRALVIHGAPPEAAGPPEAPAASSAS